MAWHLLQLELILTVVLTQPVLLGSKPVVVPVVTAENTKAIDRLSSAASSPVQNVLLVLKGVDAEVRTDTSWEVHVERPGSHGQADAQLVGIISMFGRERESSQFTFAIDRAVIAAGRSGLQARFVPTSAVVVDGVPQPAQADARVRIGEIALTIESVDR